MATADWSRKTSDVPERLRRQWRADRALRPAMRPTGGRQHVGDVEIAVAEYIDWYNHRRLHGELSHVPPVEFETNYWNQHPTTHYREEKVLTEA